MHLLIDFCLMRLQYMFDSWFNIKIAQLGKSEQTVCLVDWAELFVSCVCKCRNSMYIKLCKNKIKNFPPTFCPENAESWFKK